jgi:crotonobetainyl-CoA:carnitine CoA-transferase CaiB-like acyl-CoA transferase
MSYAPLRSSEVSTPGLPLEGYRVIDLTMNMSGPLATMLLADQGADVVKVEPPGGDPIRQVGSGSPGLTAYFANLNRNKRSIVVDLKTDHGVGIVRHLATQADVFVENFRPGVADRLGVGATALRALNQQLVYLAISGFGPAGPRRDAPAYDHVVQALSGMASLQAGNTGEPSLVRHGLVDKATAYTAAQAITAALLQRHRSGEGAVIDVSMLDVAIGFLWPDGMMDRTVEAPERDLPSIARSFRLTRTSDGFISVVTLTDRQWSGMMAAVAMEADERSGSVQGRMQHGAQTMREVVRRLGTMTTVEALARLSEHGVPCAPVVDLDALTTEPQVVASDTIQFLDHPVLGPLRQPRPAARWRDGTDRWKPAPTLGQHTDEILAASGLDPARIEQLRADRVVS